MKIFRVRRRPAALALAAAAALGLSAAGAASAAPVHPTAAEAVSAASLPRTALAASSGTVITTATTPFGPALVVGSGPFKGAPLYSITSDHGTVYGCTTQVVQVPGLGPLRCVGPPGIPGKPNPAVDWPAITTSGAPVAAGGVSKSLLATVTRPGVGTQVTYAGHPLYMFDGAPAQVTGEGILEASFPPDHGLWNLVATSGKQLPAAGMLTTMQVGGKAVLATPFNVPGFGWINAPVYSYSGGSNKGVCANACAVAWPLAITGGTPAAGPGVSVSKIKTLSSPYGTQMSYDGKPLYYYGNEGLAPTGATFVYTGSGNGVTYQGGTFKLVTP